MNCTGDCRQGRRLCVHPHACGLITANTDGSDPHADPQTETRDLVELVLDGLLSLAIIVVLVFVVFVGIGFWSAR